MYDELKERCRACSQGCNYPSECSYFNKQPLRCMRQLLSEAADAIEELSGKVDGLQFFADNISKLPDCNTCMKKHTCEFMPEYGEYCRINCPAWLGEPEPPKEK